MPALVADIVNGEDMKSEYSYKPEWYEQIIQNPLSYKTKAFCMYENLFFVGTLDSASHLVDTGQGLILFDTGYPNMQEFLVESVTELGFSVSDIKMIFHTHGHFDHFGATDLIKGLSGAMTLMGTEDAINLRDNPRLSLDYYFQDIPTKFFTIDRMLNDGDVLRIGDTKVRCIHTPGHTPGAMSYEIELPFGKKALLCGGIGFNTLNLEFMEEYKVNYRPDFEKSLGIWKNLTFDFYLGNHTPQSRAVERWEKGEKPANLNDFKKYISDVEDRYYKMLSEEG